MEVLIVPVILVYLRGITPEYLLLSVHWLNGLPGVFWYRYSVASIFQKGKHWLLLIIVILQLCI
jgi:hypothetical protein